jgi:hypothetical protein
VAGAADQLYYVYVHARGRGVAVPSTISVAFACPCIDCHAAWQMSTYLTLFIYRVQVVCIIRKGGGVLQSGKWQGCTLGAWTAPWSALVV